MGSTVMAGFAINFLSSGPRHWWWWLLLAVSTIAGIAGIILTTLGAKRDHNGQAATSVQGDDNRVQTASNGGTNVSINADNGSVAAWSVGEVNVGQHGRRGRRKES
ncbi:hypothetical protein [Mycolicibacterium llatzerense]|uniref:hypothetical protein n=2 Tax=Mycolicibacterium llatzerense TaxID=280871 RepID=UPI0031DDFB5F